MAEAVCTFCGDPLGDWDSFEDGDSAECDDCGVAFDFEADDVLHGIRQRTDHSTLGGD